MKHCGTKQLETGRLLLRRFVMDDAAAMFKNWASDTEVTKYLTWPAHASVEVSEMVLHDWVTSYEKNDYYQWAIVLKENGDEPIMSEALKAVMDFLFDEVAVNRIESRFDPNNPHSGAVMAKCGMKYEGTLRAADRNNQGICDASYYGLLRTDRK